MNYNNIPAAISTFDAFLFYGKKITIHSGTVYWINIQNLPKNLAVFASVEEITKKMIFVNNHQKKLLDSIKTLLLITQGHARSLEYVGAYFKKTEIDEFQINNLMNDLMKYIHNYSKTYENNEITKLLLLDIFQSGLKFPNYLDPSQANINDLIENEYWQYFIRDAVILNKMIKKNQKTNLNLLRLKLTLDKNLIYHEQIQSLLSITDRFDAYEKYHITYEAYKNNVLVEFCRSKYLKDIELQKIGNIWTIPLNTWLMNDHENFENIQICLNNPKTILHCIKTEKEKDVTEVFKQIMQSKEYYCLCPDSWQGFDAALVFDIFRKISKLLAILNSLY